MKEQKLRDREKSAIAAPVPAKPETPGTPQFRFYGIADVSVNQANSGYGPKTRLEGTGGFSNSRLGAQVTSTVGQVKVTALAEMGVQFDTGEAGNSTPATGANVTTPSSGGTLGTGSQVFSRQMWAGVDAGFGQISIGRQYAGSYFMMGAIGSAHGDGLYGNLTSLLPVVGAMPNYQNVTKTLSSSTGYGVSVLVPIGRSKISAGWTRLDDKSLLDKDATLYGVSYWYELTSNALLHATAGKVLNNRNANYSLLDGGNLDGNVARVGFHPNGVEGGMNYRF